MRTQPNELQWQQRQFLSGTVRAIFVLENAGKFAINSMWPHETLKMETYLI